MNEGWDAYGESGWIMGVGVRSGEGDCEKGVDRWVKGGIVVRVTE